MNKWEKKHKFQLDMIAEMITYAKNQSNNPESHEYSEALWNWSKLFFEDFKLKWEQENGKLGE